MENEQKLMMCIGVQGSGKSTWARAYSKANPDFVYLSTDKLRIDLGYGEANQSVNGIIYSEIEKRTKDALENGKSVLLDATFIKRAWRKHYVKLAKSLGIKRVAHVFKANRDVLIKRIQDRQASGGLYVPTEVVDQYIAGFQPPELDEFDEIINH